MLSSCVLKLTQYMHNAIAASDIVFYYPHETAEGDTHGGTSTTNEIGEEKNALFNDVSGDEAADGHTDYRKVFVGLSEAAGADVLSNPVVFVATTTPADDEIEIKTVFEAADNTNVQVDVSDETSWATPEEKAVGLSIENVSTDTAQAVWLRRNVPSATSAYADNSFTLQVEGETV